MSAVRDLIYLIGRPQWWREGDRSGPVRPGKYATPDSAGHAMCMLGIRINKWHRPHHWLPLILALPPLLRALMHDPESGLVGYRLLVGPTPREAMLLQYWRGLDDLRAFAVPPGSSHRSAQQRNWSHYAEADAAVGIWHEIIEPSNWHGVYGNMPPTGLAGTARSRPWLKP